MSAKAKAEQPDDDVSSLNSDDLGSEYDGELDDEDLLDGDLDEGDDGTNISGLSSTNFIAALASSYVLID